VSSPRARRSRSRDLAETIAKFSQIGALGRKRIDESSVREAVELCREIFRTALREAGFDERKITALLTKFVDGSTVPAI
jgi:predicted naringenin-chalcone synthase